ncbi:MAG: neocarzinostatin apoprotein domain-containing protein [Acidimicrobiales bacterium]
MADQRLSPTTRRALGIGCGTSAALLVGLAVLIGILASSLEGCDLDIGDPGDGKDSAHLAVAVAPSRGLRPGQDVRITSTAFGADQIVSVTACLREADTDRKGVEACDRVQGYRYATDQRGRLDATYPVPRLIRVGGRTVDCGTSPGRCLVVAADADDFDRSGGVPVSFTGPRPEATPPTERAASDHLPASAAPSAPIPAGTPVVVRASGFQPGEPLLAAWCTDDLGNGLAEACEAEHPMEAVGAIGFRTLPDATLHADAHGRVAVTLPARADVVPTTLSNFSASTSTTLDPARPRTGGHRCDLRPGRCAFVVAAAADLKRSAVAPYALTP